LERLAESLFRAHDWIWPGSWLRDATLAFTRVSAATNGAGADPGPACYGRGGVAPTVTDADLVLGYLDPSFYSSPATSTCLSWTAIG